MNTSTYVQHILQTTDYLDFIKKVKEAVLKRYGIDIEIIENHSAPFNIRLLFDIINEQIALKFGSKYPKGIKEKTRKEELLNYRQLFFYIGYTNGRSQTELARLTGTHRTTVVYCVKTIKNLLDTGNIEITNLYNTICNLYSKHPLVEEQLKQYEQSNTEMD